MKPNQNLVKRTATLLVLALLLFLVLFLLWAKYSFFAAEGWHGWCSAAYQAWTTTQYAPKYSERRFRMIHAGQPKTEVLSALGEPLSKRFVEDGYREWLREFSPDSPIPENRIERWEYSTAGDSYDYRIRAIEFQNDLVVDVDIDYYFD